MTKSGCDMKTQFWLSSSLTPRPSKSQSSQQLRHFFAECAVSASVSHALHRRQPEYQAVAVNNLGKWKTATQMAALTILLANRDSSLVDAGALVGSGVALLYISAWLAVWSLFVYMRKIWKVLLV
ncbi:PREDICTED: cardiolipin synthase (CMP-forming), mitochondrial-like [Ipomoea nil]|uniref:cardiolipin synthase (CMP-forming), mitochondrial-like n=1 Tax=Ipomoea nil TaxID=35883 RepID=UPI0009016FD5|nr:PREDICTED: cardiolipin synthase (CMP-forming), mitochondrial-like [Ipomoea nil]